MQRALSLQQRMTAVLCGGFCGTITRYLLGLLIQAYLGKGWPYDILFINISGALVLALVTTLADTTLLIGPTRRLFINAGFLGAYTTFSSFALGDIQLLTSGQLLPALLYLLSSIGGGLLAVLLGDWLGLCLMQQLKRSSSRKLAQAGLFSASPGITKEEHIDIQDDRLLPIKEEE